ncbi:sodium/glucose cotransporter 4-like [Acanthaster planci]|uniref:Sodium/glucose cotransporter 4-like n=1 Tax=Acanthaster planci TaxID=133434 RepID=A0A8B7XVH0_ACAPL|nr:sodium/glucose cotransporter 4-like [Acanthaster planci]
MGSTESSSSAADGDTPALTTLDFIIIALHFLIVFLLGIWASHRSNRGTTSGYFLAGRDMSWWLVGLSLYVSNIGSISFIGLAGTASASGYAVISYEFHGLFSLLLLGFFFIPIYFASGVFTVPGYLKTRFGGERLRMGLAIIALVFIVIGISSEMYAGIIIIQQALGWNIYICIGILLVLTTVYTMAGGLTAVIYTDALQAVIMIGGAFILMIIAFVRIGGMENLKSEFLMAVPNTTQWESNSTCGVPTEQAFHIFQDASSSGLPWPGVIFGVLLLSAWYFCANQVLVQRSLAARNVTHAKAGSILAGYFKILPMFLMIYPGMISRALWPDEVGCQEPEICKKVCNNPAGCADIAYPRLVLYLMPMGIKGLMLAAMMAALMSTLTSVFNSASSVFTMDLWKQFRPKPSELELVIVGRVVTLVLACISILWLPIIQAYGTGQLFVFIQSMTSYFSPPMFAIYVAGMFWERTNEPGAFFGLVVGFLIGVTRLVLDFVYGLPSCAEPDERPGVLRNLHYLYFACVLFMVSLLVTVVVSLLTKPIPREKLIRLTWWTRHSSKVRQPMEESQQGDRVNGHYEMVENGSPKVEDDNIEVEISIPRRAWYWLCGVGSTNKQPSMEMTPEEREHLEAKMTSIEEDPKWRRVVLVNAFVLVAVGITFFAVFA